MRLAALSLEAQQAGLSVGMTLADARVRHPDLDICEHDEFADQAWLRQMAEQCRRYSPMIALQPPDGISIEISGSAHLFRDEESLADDVEHWFESHDMTLRHAVASTAEGARALALYGVLPILDETAAISGLSVVALGLGPEATTALRRAGLKTVGALAERPRSIIAPRFGKAAIVALESLYGTLRQPTRVLPQYVPVCAERRFAEPIGSVEFMLIILSELASETARQLENRGQGGRRFRATLFRSDGMKLGLDIETGQPTRDPALLLRLFRERIETLADPLDPGFGYDRLLLQVPHYEPLSGLQSEMEGGAKREEAVGELVNRLTTRLGRNAVLRALANDSHIPERAQVMKPAIEVGEVPWLMVTTDEAPSRPLFLFDPPQEVPVTMAEIPDGPPGNFKWKRQWRLIRFAEGPERIAAEWWRYRSGRGLTRDYYRVEDEEGRRYWLFRHGLYGEKGHPRWYLHGLFA